MSRAGSLRDGARAESPQGQSQNRIDSPSPTPFDDDTRQHAAPAAAGGQAGSGNVSSFEEGDDNVAEKGAAAAGLTKGQRLKGHLSRRKWWYIIGTIIFLAIILPILFKVIIPAIVGNIVSGQKLPVEGGHLSVLTPTKLEMSLDTMLDTPIACNIDPIALRLMMPGKADAPFLTIKTGAQDIGKDTPSYFPTQEVEITDEKQLTAWFNDFFDKEEADLRVHVPALTANLGKLAYDVELDSVIKVPGLNYLKGFGVNEMEFMMPPNEKGENLKGTLNIPNSGTLTLSLGTLAFYLKAGDINLGLVSIPNLVLKPGDNAADFTGNFFFEALIPNLPDILASQGTSISKGVMALTATGNATIGADGNNIPYLEAVLNTKKIPLEIPITQLLGDLMTMASGEGAVAGVMDAIGGGGGVMGAIGGIVGGGDVLGTVGDAIGNDDMLNGMLAHFQE